MREIEQEQKVVSRIYARLDALRARYRRQLAQVRRAGASGTPQARSERDAFATHYEDTLARLENVENRLVFGRLDSTDGTSLYVGRLGISDENRRQLLIDWRAPNARPFYQATALRPGEVCANDRRLSQNCYYYSSGYWAYGANALRPKLQIYHSQLATSVAGKTSKTPLY